MERHAAPPSSTMPVADSPFLPTAAHLLGLAGFDLADDSAFAQRLVVVLDVVLGHWMATARPGAGLPEFAPEDRLRSDKRLAVRLGADRDLLYLVYGPNPGAVAPSKRRADGASPTGWRSVGAPSAWASPRPLRPRRCSPIGARSSTASTPSGGRASLWGPIGRTPRPP